MLSHEHIDAFGIINMNGRVYDPATAQFFSPDPFVQSPGDWQNYNRYAYCLNNPVMYTDPSGYQYMPQEEDTKFKWSFQDEMARTERELGLWNGGNTSIYSYLSAFNKAFQNGYKSVFTQFMRDVDKQASNSDFNGQLTFSYTTQEKSTAKFGKERIGNLEFEFTEFVVYPTVKHTFTINLLNGNYSLNENGPDRQEDNWRQNLVDGTGNLSNIVEAVSRAARYDKGLSAIKLANPVINTLKIGLAVEKDNYSLGRNTLIQASKIGGGLLVGTGGALVGSSIGGAIGGAIGFLCGGFGAIPGVYIGQAVGGAIGGYFAASYSSDLIDVVANRTK